MTITPAESWIETASDRQAVADGCTMDESAGDRVIKFVETFCKIPDPDHPKRAIPLQLLDWQRRMIRQLFGWKRPDGTRRFRFAWVEIAKKNGKSTLAAALILYLLVADGEADPEVYGAASTRDQAGIIFRAARKMVERSPALAKALNVKAHVKRIVNAKANGFYTPLPNKPAAVDGIDAHGLVFDEIHRQTSRELYDALTYAGAARSQPLQFIITTAGDDRASVGYELHERAEAILAGTIIDTETFAFIAAAGPDDDTGDPATWAKANPSLGHTVDADEFAAEYERAKDSPARMQNFKRLRLNMWVSQASRWLDIDRWLACPPTVPDAELAGRTAYGGLDLSTSVDLTAFVVQIPSEQPDGRRTHDVRAWFWLPEDNIVELERLAGVPYRAWADAGLIELTPGDVIDYSYIRQRIQETAAAYDLREIAYDPSGATQLSTELAEDGLPMFSFWQRPTMLNPVLRYLESCVMTGRLRHGDHPILNWMAGNVEVVENADGLIKPSKPRNSGKKIDGIAALAMAMGTHCKQQAAGEHHYEECPVLIL
jgi:phage terminase large subunit-like protein